MPAAVHDLLAPDGGLRLVLDTPRWYLDPAVSPYLAREGQWVAEEELRAHYGFIEASRAAGVPVVWTAMTEGDDHAPGCSVPIRARTLHRLCREGVGCHSLA